MRINEENTAQAAARSRCVSRHWPPLASCRAPCRSRRWESFRSCSQIATRGVPHCIRSTVGMSRSIKSDLVFLILLSFLMLLNRNGESLPMCFADF